MQHQLRVIASFLALAASPASAQELWGNVRAGMTRAEVLSLQPKASEPKEKWKFGNGAVCELEISSMLIAEQPFRTCFAFINGRLDQVYFKSTSSPNKSQYEAVVVSMHAQHGDPQSSGPTPGGGGYATEWPTRDGVKTKVMYIAMIDPRVIIIVHQADRP